MEYENLSDGEMQMTKRKANNNKKSPKCRHAMKRDAENNDIKFVSRCDIASIKELFGGEANHIKMSSDNIILKCLDGSEK